MRRLGVESPCQMTAVRESAANVLAIFEVVREEVSKFNQKRFEEQIMVEAKALFAKLSREEQDATSVEVMADIVRRKAEERQKMGREFLDAMQFVSAEKVKVKAAWVTFVKKHSRAQGWKKRSDALAAIIPGIQPWFSVASIQQLLILAEVLADEKCARGMGLKAAREFMHCFDALARGLAVLRIAEPEEFAHLREKIAHRTAAPHD